MPYFALLPATDFTVLASLGRRDSNLTVCLSLDLPSIRRQSSGRRVARQLTSAI